jgi:hypothetical protein
VVDYLTDDKVLSCASTCSAALLHRLTIKGWVGGLLDKKGFKINMLEIHLPYHHKRLFKQ